MTVTEDDVAQIYNLSSVLSSSASLFYDPCRGKIKVFMTADNFTSQQGISEK